ncbi:hypothetical protein LTR01_006238 [Friedmanniomyces endolithicus]|nr:hypothetical protein LTS09_012743 [Friedmanniomyces endolithicus]KAK0306380.1 hypothetical protein LTR01_006238 [Friedmanniomyces endolithicus]KAK0825006.1 hypothetical protein LTR73_007293 [Friedmanniomyces endolithicus]
MAQALSIWTYSEPFNFAPLAFSPPQSLLDYHGHTLKTPVEMPYLCGQFCCSPVRTISAYFYISSSASLTSDCIGLLSLTIEFYRIPTTSCTHDDLGIPISANPGEFPYLNATCGLTCDTNLGPFSTMREGSGNNIYVIPAPNVLTFNAATLLAAACCIPAVLLLVVMWMQILEIMWKKSNSNGDGNESVRRAKRTTRVLRLFRKFFEVPLWAAAVLAIMITGERNLFSPQVHYQTEPMASQWAPIVGIAFALFGALYLSLTEAMQAPTEEAGFKNRVARLFLRVGDHFGAVAREVFDDSEFRQGRATSEFPEVPGERNRNRELSRIRTTYSQNHRHEENGSFDLAREETFSTNPDSRVGAEDDRHETQDRPLRRRDTLEVPAIAYYSGPSPVGNARAPPDATQSVPTPSIVVSHNPDDADPAADVVHTDSHVT